MTCAHCGGPLAERILRVRWWVRLGLLVLGFITSYAILGAAMGERAEGMETLSIVRPWLVVPLAVLAAAALAPLVRVRSRVCEACGLGRRARVLYATPAAEQERLLAMPARRRMLRQALGALIASAAGGAAAMLGVGLRNRGWVRVGQNIGANVETTSRTYRPEWKGSRVRAYRRLGRTGAMVSDISLGSANIGNVEVARLALERGVTYFDTSPDYAQHGSEHLLGEALAGRRDEVFIASKLCTADGHLPPETPVPRIIEAVEGSLKRLRTDRIDLLHIHSCDRVERLNAPNFHEAFDRLREQGKARFLGVSSHTPNLREVANAAIDSGRFDVLMLAYHHGMGWDLDRILARAAEKDVAVVAMKTLKGAKHENLAPFQDQAASYTQAAFRWVLANPQVSCLVISFSRLQHVDEYLFASGTQLTQSDRRVLARYDELIAGEYCRPYCGACLDSCVASLPINDILRYKTYFEDYGAEKLALAKYARLDGADASQCIGCPAPCAGTCPFGVPIQAKMLEAQTKLRLI